MAGRRAVLTVATVSVAAAAAGYGAATRLHAPADAYLSAQPPEARPVSAPVERRTIEDLVVARGDAVFDGAIDVHVDVTGVTAVPIVTGVLRDVGDTVVEGDVLVEIADRPVIVLAGDVPAYRDLVPGTRGDDATQLEAALVRLGHDPGRPDDTYDADTAAAVANLYESVGYDAPAPGVEATARRDTAAAAMAAADTRVALAAAARTAATAEPSRSAVLAADAAVAAAQRDVDAATSAGDAALLAAASEQLGIARAQRDELLAVPDTTLEQAELVAAQSARDDAAVELWHATIAAATPVPAAEVVFVPGLPRRVDLVTVGRGETVDAAVARLSGVDLVVRAELGSADRQSVSVGIPAEIEGAGLTIDGTVTALDDDPDTGSAVATISLADVTEEQVATLAGRNVKVTIPVAASEGAVLAVPIAAVSAAGDGSSRVDVLLADGATRLVTVDVGLVAGGFAEVRATDGNLAVGDEVVVGR